MQKTAFVFFPFFFLKSRNSFIELKTEGQIRRTEYQSQQVLLWMIISSFSVSSSLWPPEKNLLRNVAQDVKSLIEKHARQSVGGRPPWIMALTGLYSQKQKANSVNYCVCVSARQRKNKVEWRLSLELDFFWWSFCFNNNSEFLILHVSSEEEQTGRRIEIEVWTLSAKRRQH